MKEWMLSFKELPLRIIYQSETGMKVGYVLLPASRKVGLLINKDHENNNKVVTPPKK